ncbi:MAG: hypothetical protein ACLGH4_04030 [Actinomycetes bacterium]
MADADKSTEPRRARREQVRAGGLKLRTRLASVVWLVAVVCALLLAVGALVVALRMNPDNALVAFIRDGAELLDFGSFKEFEGKNAEVKEHLVDWGIAAVIYLVAGKVLDRVIRP